MGLSQIFAEYIHKLKFEDLPREVVDFTKYCILDWYGCAVAGKDEQPIKILTEMIHELGGSPQATCIDGVKSSIANAAFINGAASHMVELDDIHKKSIIHAATVVIPAAIAAAEWKNKSGKDLIAAVAIGYEVCYRIGEAVSPSHYEYWHNTATCGTFGAAAAVSKLLGLNETQIVHALGNAGTQAAGLWEFIEDDAMTKQLHPGKAAYNGVISALLAEKGFTGATNVLEGRRGFFNAMSKTYNSNMIFDQLGNRHKIIENSFKIHASCRHTHAAVDLVLEFAEEYKWTLDDISKINVKTYKNAIDIAGNPDPESVYASKFSIEFCVALALLTGQAGLSNFNEETLHNTAVRSLMEKVETSVDEKVENNYPEKWGTVIEIYLKDGKFHRKETEFPRGDPENPVPEQMLQDKFKSLTSKFSKVKSESKLQMILNLNDVRIIENFL